MNRTPPENLPEKSPSLRPTGCRGGLFQANLKAYLDGETSAIRGWLVRGHLAQCAACREELRWLRRLGEDMKELESTRPRPELRARILASLPTTPPAPGIRVVHSRPDRERAPQLMPRLALASGLAMVLAFGSVFALKRSSSAITPGEVRNAKSVQPDTNNTVEASADTQESIPKAMEMVDYTPLPDPNNALAEKMFHERMAERTQEQVLLGQDDWHRLMAQARAVAHKSNSTTPTEIGITLAVPEIAAVKTNLPGWAKQNGAELVAIGKPASETSDNATGLPLRTEDPRANMVAFYVPAQRGPAFLGALKHLGQVNILPLPSKSVASAAIGQPASPVQAEMNTDSRFKAIPSVPVASDSGAPAERSVTSPEKHLKTGRYLVVTVLLTTPHN